MNYLDDNLLKVKSINERLYQELIDTSINYAKYRVITTKSNDCTAKIVYLDNDVQKEQLVHSKYNPQQEAKKFAEANICEKKIYILYGFALGYHVEEMLKLMDVNDVLFVIDLDLQLFKLALTIRDNLLNIITDDRLTLIISADEKYVASQIKQVLNDDVAFITYTPSVQTIAEEYSYFKFILEDWKMQQTVTDKWVGLLRENYQINKDIDCPNVGTIFGQFKDVPMVLVAAGPSLNKNKHFLKYIKGKFLIFAVGSALKPLLSIGVKPDFFCIIDPKIVTYKQIEGYEDLDIPFVFLESANAHTVSIYNGPKYIASNNPNNQKNNNYVIETGGSVATAVLDIGIKLGCNPIIFVGQDLAYTNNEHHADAKMYSPHHNEKVKELPNMRKVMGQNGELLNTTLGLLSFKYWIENKVKDHREIMFFNATEGGATIQGAKHFTLAETVGYLYNLHAEKQLPNIRRSDCIIFLLGIGLGIEVINYYRQSSESQIIIIEPDVHNVELALEYNKQLEEVLETKNVKLLTGNQLNELEQILKEYIDIRHQNNIYIVKTYTVNIDRLALFERIEATIRNDIHEIDLHVNTTNALSEQICENIIFNLPDFIFTRNELNSIKDVFLDKPAVIVSAGPSLEENIHFLKDIQNKVVIIAGPKTLEPLLNNGITPHILCNIDPHNSTYNYVKMHDITDISVICLIQSNYKFAAHSLKKIYVFDSFLDSIRAFYSDSEPINISVGGSVATFSLSIAKMLGCNPIILIGQDLSYSDNKKHAFVKSNNNIFDRAIMVRDKNGLEVATRRDWLYFKRNFEEHIASDDKTNYINATIGGLDIKGAINMNIENVIQKYCQNSFNAREILASKLAVNYKSNREEVRNNILEIATKLRGIKKYTQDNLLFAEDIYNCINGTMFTDINKILEKMDTNDMYIESDKLVNSLMHYYIQKDYLNITLNYSPMIGESIENEQLRIANKNIELYKAKLKAIEYIEGKLQTIYEEASNNDNHLPETKGNS